MPVRDISISYKDGSTLSEADAILEQYEIALFTSPSEFSPDPTFGIGIEDFISEPNTPTNAKALKQQIIARTKARFPEILIERIAITAPQDNQLNIQLDILIVPYGERATINKEISE